ncbi:DMT family transporter [Glutamicibacter sp. PS]|uniref:DMT family transporter n=1 Tax=Glutamicibacter sp. PS TaxID=3075634 RepID=UPI00285127E5|nr:DMT family transporter [Glutamicibacter sp. PS]MDR4533496.1 DMT family transporter [Glutamicibacter sp. PS]
MASPTRPPKNLGFLLLIVALLGGSLLPIQSRINGALSTTLGDPVTASTISFCMGLVVLSLLAVVLPKARRAVVGIPRVLKRREFPWWYLLAGVVGTFTVASQSVVVPALGVALFTVALVTGQSIGSLVIDRIGFGPGGPRRISATRLIGALLTVGGVLWAVSPRLELANHLGLIVLPVVCTLTVGVLLGFQSAAVGVQANAYGSALAATFMNFLVGTLILGLVLALRWSANGMPQSFPSSWWYYSGGLLGCIFVGVAAFLVRRLGVLVTGLSMICGQLLGSLLLDLLVPTAGTVLSPATVAGTVLTMLAAAIAALPSRSAPAEARRTV